MSFSPTTSFVASKDHVYCELEGEAVILNLKDGIYYGLNAVGLRLWELVQQPATFEHLVTTIFDEYEVERAELEVDIASILHALVDKRMVAVG